jgi:uncharacterized protein YqeY
LRLPDATLGRVTITKRVQSDLTAATKARDQDRVGALRLVLDALRKEAKEAREELDEQREIAVLKRERKRRVEAADAYRGGQRTKLAAKEEAEAAVIDEYLPEQLSDAELEAIVGETVAETGAESAREIGTVMSAVMPKLGGRADGRRVSEIVRRKLA